MLRTRMTANDILGQLKIAVPNINVEKVKTMRDCDRSLLVTTTNGKEMVFTYLAPGVWDICSVKYYKKKGEKK